MPASFISSPPAMASASPFSGRGTSTQPVTSSSGCPSRPPAREGGVDDIGPDAGLLHQLAAGDGLGLALLGEGHIDPAGEQVLGVPIALAVAEQHECVGHGPSVREETPRPMSRAAC